MGHFQRQWRAWRLAVAAGVLAGAGAADAQQIERGVIKELSVAEQRLVVVQDGRERTLRLSERTAVLDAAGQDLAEKLREFRPGRGLFFRAGSRDGQEAAEALKLAAEGGAAPRRGSAVQAGEVKQVDLENKRLVLAVDGKEVALVLTDETRSEVGRGATWAERFQALRPGVRVEFLTAERDGQTRLAAIRLAERGAGGERQLVSPAHRELQPLTELASGKYQGFAGGLYPAGKNERPAGHEAAGRKLAGQIRPLDKEGKPSTEGGKVVLLSIGMSNTSQASGGFRAALAEFGERRPALAFVDGAQGGMTAETIDDAHDGGRGERYWQVVDERLAQAGLSRAQVQAVWIKQADASPRDGFPGYPQRLQRELKAIVQILAGRFPNLKQCFLSSRTYGGYATTPLNPEPAAYESGFAVKWLIEEQLGGAAELNYDPDQGPVRAPWLSWGPYLWANGGAPRSDGFSYAASDFAADGTHHSPAGSRKIGAQMLDFFRHDTATKPWFVR